MTNGMTIIILIDHGAQFLLSRLGRFSGMVKDGILSQ